MNTHKYERLSLMMFLIIFSVSSYALNVERDYHQPKLLTSNDYSASLDQKQSLDDVLKQPKITQPHIAGINPINNKDTQQPDSKIYIVPEKGYQAQLGGSSNQHNHLKKFLGKNY